MKLHLILISTLVLTCSSTLFSKNERFSCSPLAIDIAEQQQVAHWRIALLTTLMSTVGYVHKDNIVAFIQHHPLWFTLIGYVAGNYLIDTYGQYTKCKNIVCILNASHFINHYMLCIFAIKNSLKNKSTTFNEQDFLQTFTTATGYDFSIIDKTCSEFLQNSMHIIETFKPQVYNMHEQMYWTVQDTITIESLMNTVQKNHFLYTTLKKCEENIQEHNQDALKIITSQLAKKLLSIIHKNLHFIA
ncbi:hypothetical protein KBD08_03560 [Candidatus Babeliales bacterium]|nr:hypothetical protein [Candidatus Babeliales bacterium]